MDERTGPMLHRKGPVFEPYSAQYLEDRRIGFVMRVSLRNLRNALKQKLAVYGIPWSVWYYLRTLWEEDGLTQRELTSRVGMTQPTTVTALRTLERLGLVTLERVDKDRRKMRIRLTRRGKYLERKLLPEIQKLNDEVALQGFSKREREELKKLLIRMYFNLDEHVAAAKKEKV